MDDKKLGQLLAGVYNKDIAPTDETITSVKRKIRENRSLDYLIGAFILANVFLTVSFCCFIIFASYSLVFKSILCLSISSVLNVSVLAILLNQRQVRDIFSNIDRA